MLRLVSNESVQCCSLVVCSEFCRYIQHQVQMQTQTYKRQMLKYHQMLKCTNVMSTFGLFVLPLLDLRRGCRLGHLRLASHSHSHSQINCRRFQHLGPSAIETCLKHKSDWNICANLVLEDLCVGCQDRTTDGFSGLLLFTLPTQMSNAQMPNAQMHKCTNAKC